VQEEHATGLLYERSGVNGGLRYAVSLEREASGHGHLRTFRRCELDREYPTSMTGFWSFGLTNCKQAWNSGHANEQEASRRVAGLMNLVDVSTHTLTTSHVPSP
jgi:hypothetical protein